MREKPTGKGAILINWRQQVQFLSRVPNNMKTKLEKIKYLKDIHNIHILCKGCGHTFTEEDFESYKQLRECVERKLCLECITDLDN